VRGASAASDCISLAVVVSFIVLAAWVVSKNRRNRRALSALAAKVEVTQKRRHNLSGTRAVPAGVKREQDLNSVYSGAIARPGIFAEGGVTLAPLQIIEVRHQ